MDYPKSTPSVGLVNGRFVDENPVNGSPGSLIPAVWGNAVTTEILGVIQDAGFVPDESTNTQLAQAVRKIVADSKPGAATEADAGVLRLATALQVANGIDDTAAVTSKKLAQKLATAAQGQSFSAFTTGGVAPAFTLSPSPAVTAYVANQRFQVKFHAGGAGADTINVSGLGAKSLKQYSSNGNKVSAVIQGQLTDVVYDGVDFVLLDQLPNSSGVTSAQFDNSTNLATTAFVQGVGLQFSNVALASGNMALTAAAHAGGIVIGSSPSAISVTLPASSTVPPKVAIKFWNYGAGVMTLVPSGVDSIYSPGTVTSFSVPTGSWVTLVSTGAGVWYAVDMSGIGVGQTRQVFAVGSTRVAGTTYYNTTGRPIWVYVQSAVSNTLGGAGTLTVGGSVMNFPTSWYSTPTSGGGGISAMVLPGESYVASNATVWIEIR